MKKAIFILSILISQSAWCQCNLNNISLSSSEFMNYENNAFSLIENDAFKAVESKFTHGNLRIYMLKANNVYINSNKDLGNYKSLKEAIDGNKIKISELDGGTVNTLQFENLSKDTIMVMAGEVVTGGKQDRVVGQDLLLLPNSGKVMVSVFCVEHGRWSPKTTGNQFNGTFGVTNGSVRKQAVINKNQSGVWQKVAEMNSKNSTETSTGTYAALQNSETLTKLVPEYTTYFEPLLNEDTSYIGFVAVTGDTIISCDLFANNQMFKKQAGQLLKSAAVEAITNGAVVGISAVKVMDFLKEFLSDEENQENTVNEKGTLLKHNGKKLHLNYYQSK